MAEFAAVNRTQLGRERRHLVTPEGVDLSLTLADIGQRAGAFLLDWLIIIVAIVALFFVAGTVANGLRTQGGGELASIVFLLGLFLARNFYFILMEMGPRAATFGKRAVGIRVVAKSGDRLTADRVIARNLTREIEAYLPMTFIFYNLGEGGGGWLGLAGLAWTFLFLFFPTFNRDRLRVGDLLAGTWVINAPKRKLTVELAAPAAAEEAAEPAFRFTDAQLDTYGVYELQVLEQVLRDDQPESIANVAATIRHKINATLMGDNREFLVAYYQAARARMERGLLFGKRREDKFDRGDGG